MRQVSPSTPSLSRRATLAALTSLTLGASLCTPVSAESAYPAKPIRLVVGYAPGGVVDVVARIVADMLTKSLQATVVVDNVSGAAGVLGAQRVVNAAPDGYTLLVGSSNELAATKQVNPAQKYDPLKDFTPVSLLSRGGVLWVAGAHVPVKNLDEFLALAKSHPGKYSYGSSGVGSTLHFAAELLKQQAHLKLTHVPYKGTATLTSDLAGGTLDFAMVSPPAALPFIQSGRIKALGVTSAARMALLPQVPAIGENPALKGYELSGWMALVGPRQLPAEVTQKLAAALQQGLKDPDFRKRLEAAGMEPASQPQDLLAVMQGDSRKYAELVKFADMKE